MDRGYVFSPSIRCAPDALHAQGANPAQAFGKFLTASTTAARTDI
jgi:hypothetical protein